MARGKNNRRSERFNPPGFGSDPDLAKLLKEMGIGFPGLNLAGVKPKAKPKTTANTSELMNEWQDAVIGLISGHTGNKRVRGEQVKGSLELKSVKPEEGCDVVLKCGASTYRASWTFDLDARTFSASCNCGHHDLCEHTYFMAMKLKGLLNDPRSELVGKILGEDFADRQLKQTFSMLQSLARNATMAASTIEGTAVIDKPLTRFVWNIRLDGHYKSIHLGPCLQQEKKNGGWTKGKETTLEAFLKSPRDQWTAVDQQIAEFIKQDRWQSPTLELADALRILAGTDQFTFDREPCELESRPLEIVVQEVEGGLRLSTSATDLINTQPAGSPTVIADAKRGVFVVLQEKRQAIYFPGPPHSSEICLHLKQQTDIIPLDKKDALLKELEPLRSCMAVRLPESIAGQDVPYDGKMTLVLQLRRNGMLDASIQVRDRNQMLQSPGEGLARIHATVDDKPVQHVRNLPDEVHRARELATELKLKRGVPISRCGWRISDADDISNLLSDAGVSVERGELVVLWHKDSVSRFDVIGRLTANNVRVTVSRQRDWFGLTGTCRIGEQEIPLKDLLAGMHGRPTNGLMEISPGKWAAVAEELRNALRRLSDVSLESRGKLQLDASAIPVVSALEAARIQVDTDKHWEKSLKRLREATDTVYDPPAGLNAQLRDYQLEGFRWLCRLSHWGIGGILADDMGLGKTVQALAMLLTRVESGPTLVIAPTSLGFNWQRECERFTPSLTPIVFRDIDRLDLKNHVGDGDVVICSYGLALREAEVLKDIKWGTMILDEAQNIKNSNSKTAAQIRTFQADWKVALTGTPMENHLGELWSIFHTVAPGVLGSWEQFRKRFAAPIEKDRNSDRREGLAQVIAPFILRRSKAEVLKDLPERTETNLMVDLSAEERTRYDQMRLAAVSELDEIGDDSLSHDQRFKVLQMLTRMRQLSCHIGLVDDTWKGSSAKLDVLMEQLEQLKERGNRPLIFSQFTTHLGLIREACDKAGITYQYLDGQTTPAQRQQRVEAFQNGESDAFLISLKAGGTGLNLTAADYVIHMDPWWNPAVEDQATDRAHRIGQTKPVNVYRIIARGTIEEQILAMHEEKRDLVDGVLSGADAAAKLSTKELADLIRLGVDPSVSR
ncbi:MAG: DEAD/DEAH box helicase [Planctomycetota bacterium]|nr:DEAD/DEAH box helicase [Planctomycetota bacterium]